MTIAIISVFVFSLIGIIVLFVWKKIEITRGVLIGGSARDGADLFALRVKWVFLVIEWYLARLPDFTFFLARHGIRVFALYLARFAREAEAQAYRLADTVSHKRNFERRETKSQYLKQVGEHQFQMKNGLDSENSDSSHDMASRV